MSTLDYRTSSSKDILTIVVNYYTTLREQLVNEKVLCDEAGQHIIHIFKLRGNFETVLRNFDNYLYIMKTKLELGKELSNEERELLMVWAVRNTEFKMDNPHFANATEKARAAFNSSNYDQFAAILSEFTHGMESAKEYRLRLHNAKQCLCYCNH